MSIALATVAASGVARGASLPASCSAAKPVIGVALPNTVNPYYIAMRDSFIRNGAALGFDVKIAIANDSDTNQLSQIGAFVTQKVCAVALNAVNSGPGAASVRALNDAGIPVFTVNVIISDDDLKAQDASFVEYVGADQAAGGRQIGERLLKDMGAQARIGVGIVGDPDQIPTNQRDEGLAQALKADPNAHILQTVNGKVDPSVSLEVASDLLQAHPDMNVVWADTGPGAVGALQAISQHEKGGTIKLYAFCAADEPLTSTYAACAAQEPADYARILLTNLKTFLSGSSVPKQVLRPLKIFTNGQKPGPGEVG